MKLNWIKTKITLKKSEKNCISTAFEFFVYGKTVSLQFLFFFFFFSLSSTGKLVAYDPL